MRKWIFMLAVLVHCLYAQTHDPFAKPAKKILLNQRYLYLGYIEFQSKKWALIKPVAKDIERIGMGKVPGLGDVKMINSNKVCVEKNHHHYCLYKSAQAGIWR